MNFSMKKPPIINNQQRSYKRSLNLHLALIIVSIVAVFTRGLTITGEATGWQVNESFKALLMLAVGALFSVVIELFYALSEGKSEDFRQYKRWVDPINTGLLIALLLPTTTPIYVLLLAVFVGVYIGKLVFGGYGYYIFNPVLVGVLFVSISFGSNGSGTGFFDYLTATPLMQLKAVLTEGTSLDFSITQLLIGNYEAIAIGSTSIIILALAMTYLIITKVIDVRISGVYVLTIVVISSIIGFVNFGGATLAYVLVNLMTGLTMFGAVFLVAESVSSPTSREAKLIYAVIVAIMTMLVRVVGSATEGVVFAVLLGNMITPYINRTVTTSNRSFLIKTSIVLVVLVLIVGFTLGFIVQGRLIELFTVLVGGAF
jgi:electron transport complex protein RnfD